MAREEASRPLKRNREASCADGGLVLASSPLPCLCESYASRAQPWAGSRPPSHRSAAGMINQCLRRASVVRILPMMK